MNDAAIACPQPLAADAAYRVLRAGGNAMDAAITAALVQGVVDPQMCGIGGGGSLITRTAEGHCEVIEFYPRAGSGVRPDQWEADLLGEVGDKYGYLVRDARNDVGYESVAVPASVRGYALALERHGTIPWDEAIVPAAEIAERGFEVTGALAGSWSGVVNPELVPMRQRIQTTPESRRIFTKDGALYGTGELLRQPDLASTLWTLAAKGPEDLYTGSIGRALAADLEANGSSITAGDLASCRADVVAPLAGTFRGRDVLTVPPPGGGICILQMLNLIEALGDDVAAWPTAKAAAEVAEAMAWAFADRDSALADPRYHPVPVESMVSKARARAAAGQVRMGGRHVPGPAVPEPATTSHICVVDAHGNAVSLTHTLGSSSGVVAQGLGFSLNNYLNTFDPRPGRPNSLEPGKTRFTMMSPTIVVDGGSTRIVIGAPGGTKIAGAIFQTLLHLLDRGLDAVAAVSAPRIDRQTETIEAEGRIPRHIVDALTTSGYPVHRRPMNFDPYFAQVQVIVRDRDGAAYPASDPRRDGGAAIRIPVSGS